uniref:Uncharacterized protein n=1 Tax=Arundo donax TaxID=35708 RepID=A0A0A9EYE0_ARUDO
MQSSATKACASTEEDRPSLSHHRSCQPPPSTCPPRPPIWKRTHPQGRQCALPYRPATNLTQSP